MRAAAPRRQRRRRPQREPARARTRRRGRAAESARVLRPGAPAVIVVPAGPRTVRLLRPLSRSRAPIRPGRAVRASARVAGLEVVEDLYLGSSPVSSLLAGEAAQSPPLRPAQRRRRCEARVTADIAHTRDSRAGRAAWRVEQALLRRGAAYADRDPGAGGAPSAGVELMTEGPLPRGRLRIPAVSASSSPPTTRKTTSSAHTSGSRRHVSGAGLRLGADLLRRPVDRSDGGADPRRCARATRA